MPIVKKSERQYALVAKGSFVFGDLTSGAFAGLVDLPAGAHVTGGSLVITEAFNSGATDETDIGVAGTPAQFLDVAAALNGVGVGVTALVPDETTLVVATELGITWTGGGAAPTTGAGYLLVEYVEDDRANEVFG